MHGSCRKAHGHGADGLAVLDKIIERTLNEPFERPQQLFLTGDQIYADDVAMMLLPQLTTAANALFGAPEEFPLKTQTGEIKVAVSPDNFPTSWRQELLRQQAKFSSGEANCHVLSFGEFCALYLFFWSGELWDDTFIEKGDIFPVKAINDDCIDSDDLGIDTIIANEVPAHLRFLYPPDKRKELVEAWHELCEDFDGQLAHVKAFKKTLPKVRRALANVATYMIFDDHEITDDWYLTQDWRDKVLTSPSGVTILRNGLTSFALFQAWGNDPRRYQSGDHASLMTRAQSLITASGAIDIASANALDALYGFDGNPSKVKWHFTVPGGATDIVVLDTRTRRTFNGRYTPPGLILSDDLSEQLPAELSPGTELMIVVSPVPVLGLAAIEELAQPIGARAYYDFIDSAVIGSEPAITGYMEFDMEAWSLHPESFEALLARFNEMGKVLILSGDVHYGFSAEMDYWKKAQPTPGRIIQLTASALKNEWEAGPKRVLETVTAQEILHNAYYPMARLGWHDPLDLTGNVNVPGGAIPRRIRALLRRNPTVLPAHNWEAGSSISVDPDWVWRVSLVKDLRPDDNSPDARPSDGQAGSISPDINPANAVDAYIKVMERAEKQLKSKIARSVVFASNLGFIRFSGTGDTLKVNHTLMYDHPGGSKAADPQAYTDYEISFASTTDPQPGIS